MAKSGIKSGLRSARRQHIINNNNNNETIIAPATIKTEVNVKQEPVNEEFKEFAETAMNELLGWYGYGSSGARDSAGAEMARPSSCRSNSNSNSSNRDSPIHANCCGWCGKSVDDTNGLLSGNSSFCSELCFSQSRRANFKKNKTCDWCRHVRHTVSYVDFQEGAAQLQFCSDKCLNQYKMHIFCRETQAHLEFHPHLVSNSGDANLAGGSGLITPDLWLRDCKTPPEEEQELDDDNSRTECSSSPLVGLPVKRRSPTRRSSVDKVPKLIPIITLAPTSSLLASPTSIKRSQTGKKARNKRKRFSSSTVTSESTPLTSTNIVDEEVAQDLRVRHNITPPPRLITNSPPTTLNNFINSSNDLSASKATINTSSPTDRRVPSPCINHDLPSTNQEANRPSTNMSMLPPVTVLVPYPIMIPVPIPIPIPLPISSFLRAYFGTKATNNAQQNEYPTNSTADQERSSNKTKNVEELSTKHQDARTDVNIVGSTSLTAEDDEIVVDVVEDEPRSPRMLRRRKKMLGTTMDNKGSNSKLIKKKL